MTPDLIRKLTTSFIAATQRTISSSSELEGVSIALLRNDDSWDLLAIQKPFRRRDYTTVVEIPKDLPGKPLNEAMIDLACVITQKLTASRTIINSNLKRPAAVKSAVGRAASAKRWHS